MWKPYQIPVYETKPDSPAARGEAPVGLVDEKTAVRVLSRRMTGMALHSLAKICETSKNDAARVNAAKEILERAWGKSRVETMETDDKPDTRITVVFGDENKKKPKALKSPAPAEPAEPDDDNADDGDDA